MTLRKSRDLALAFLAAFSGYIVFDLIGFPAAALTGSALAVTLVSLLGLDADLPVRLRNACILVVGINIGTAVTPATLHTAAAWPVSLAIMTCCVLAIMFFSTIVLEKVFGFDRATAVLGATPGHLSFVLSIAAETNRNVSAVAIMQSVRVLLLTLCVPPVVSLAFGITGVDVLPESVVKPWHLGLIGLLSVPVSMIFAKLQVPAAWLLAGMAVSALGHGTGLTPGRLPEIVSIAAFIMMGTLIGSRFSSTSPRTALSYILPGLTVTFIAVLLSMVGVFVTGLVFELSNGLLTLAFAPGGVEAMAAIAFSLGYDPAFVAAHHVFRLIVLSVVTPLVCRKFVT